jgi:hypothetical protein
VHVIGNRWLIQIGKRKISLGTNSDFVGYPAEVGWSADNRTFYITQGTSDFGQFLTRLYRVNDDKIEELSDVTETAVHNFDRRYGCRVMEQGKLKLYRSNVGVLKWAKENQLLLITEVPPDNICKHASYFGGYLVSVPDGRIIERYGPDSLYRQWGSIFGIRLKGDYETIENSN